MENDISQKVMRQVIRFEKRRTLSWLLRLGVIALILAALSLFFFTFAAQELAEKETLSLLELFQQDQEIIAEFWQDTLSTIWEELPREQILISLVALVGLVSLVILFRKKIALACQRLRSLVKFFRR